MNSAGPLTALKTTLELRGDDDIVRVFVVKVVARRANETLKLLRNVIEPSAIGLQHLRRFARPDEVQLHIRQTRLPFGDVTTPTKSTIPTTHLFLLVGRITLIDLSQLEDILARTKEPTTRNSEVFTLLVPLLAPSSAEQAKSWSISYWPTVYRKSNPFGPHPSILSNAEREIIIDYKIWMGMAEKVATHSKSNGYGEAIGAVIVERGPLISRAVALAGDGRWKDYDRDGMGNPMAHAVLRAIGMTAQKLKVAEENEPEHSRVPYEQERDIFLDSPILPEEDAIYSMFNGTTSFQVCQSHFRPANVTDGRSLQRKPWARTILAERVELELVSVAKRCQVCRFASRHGFARVDFSRDVDNIE